MLLEKLKIAYSFYLFNSLFITLRAEQDVLQFDSPREKRGKLGLPILIHTQLTNSHYHGQPL